MPEFAEEILGMPVRIGFPAGVRGITQLVNGPQHATGVGLVKYGAHALAEAVAREQAPSHSIIRVQPHQVKEHAAIAAAAASLASGEKAPKSKLWEWLKAAF